MHPGPRNSQKPRVPFLSAPTVYIYTSHSNSLVPLPWSCHPRSGGVVSRPAPTPEQWWSDGVGRAGTGLLLIVRMWLTLGPVLSLYWEQEQGQDHNNTAQSLLIMRLITSAVQSSIGSTTSFHYHRGGPTTSAFTFKTLLRHYVKWALNPQ